MPLSYSFNALLNNRKGIRKYLDISPDGVSGQLFFPNDAYWTKGMMAEIAAKQAELGVLGCSCRGGHCEAQHRQPRLT